MEHKHECHRRVNSCLYVLGYKPTQRARDCSLQGLWEPALPRVRVPAFYPHTRHTTHTTQPQGTHQCSNKGPHSHKAHTPMQQQRPTQPQGTHTNAATKAHTVYCPRPSCAPACKACVARRDCREATSPLWRCSPAAPRPLLPCSAPGERRAAAAASPCWTRHGSISTSMGPCGPPAAARPGCFCRISISSTSPRGPAAVPCAAVCGSYAACCCCCHVCRAVGVDESSFIRARIPGSVSTAPGYCGCRCFCE
jgi:hypothetical protein